MRHLLELLSLLILLAVGHAALHVAAGVLGRAVRSFAVWSLYAGGVIAVLASPVLSAALARLGLVALGAYAVRMIVAGLAEGAHGPYLFNAPKAADLALIARRVSGLTLGASRRLCRRTVRRYGGDLSLLGLLACWEGGDERARNLEEAWPQECENERVAIRRMVEAASGSSDSGRLNASDATFLAQALCLYRRRSVERVLSTAKRPLLGGRSARARLARVLEREGRARSAAEELGLLVAVPAHPIGPSPRVRSPGILGFLWPAVALKRVGFQARATMLAVVEGLLLLYGFFGLSPLGRAGVVPVWSSSGLVFVVSAVVIHIEALFALGDFQRLAACLGAEGDSEGEGS